MQSWREGARPQAPPACRLGRPHCKTDFGRKHPKGFQVFTKLPECTHPRVRPRRLSPSVARERAAVQCCYSPTSDFNETSCDVFQITVKFKAGFSFRVMVAP